jgi:hypothetical protein
MMHLRNTNLIDETPVMRTRFRPCPQWCGYRNSPREMVMGNSPACIVTTDPAILNGLLARAFGTTTSTTTTTGIGGRTGAG